MLIKAFKFSEVLKSMLLVILMSKMQKKKIEIMEMIISELL